MYKAEIEPGPIWRRHIDQLRDSEFNENLKSFYHQ